MSLATTVTTGIVIVMILSGTGIDAVASEGAASVDEAQQHAVPTQSPYPSQATMMLQLDFRGFGQSGKYRSEVSGLRSFLAAHVAETWSMGIVDDENVADAGPLDPDSTTPTTTQASLFYLRAAPTDSGMVVEISFRDTDGRVEALAEREITTKLGIQAQLQLWILLKSVVQRHLQRLGELASAESDVVLSEEAQAHSAMGEGGDTASNSEELHGLSTSGSNTAVETKEETQAVGVWRRTVLAGLWLESPELLSPLVTAGISYQRGFLQLGSRLGYRHASSTQGLVLDIIPLSVELSFYRPGSIQTWAGFCAGAALKRAHAFGTTVWTMGADAGVWLQAALPAIGGYRVIMRAENRWRLRRATYAFVVDGGAQTSLREHSWVAAISAGVAF